MNWKITYRAALVEINFSKLLNLIHDTETAISVRSKALPAATAQELQEMNDATCTLDILRKHAQGFAD